MNIHAVTSAIEEQGIPIFLFPGADEVLDHLVRTIQHGDVVLIMSNGGFGDLQNRLLSALKA